MNKITKLLRTHKDEKLEKFLTAYKQNPYHARVIFKSGEYTHDLKEDKLYFEQYLDIDGNPIPTEFRYVVKTTYHMMDAQLQHKTKTITSSYLKSKDHKFTLKETAFEINTETLTFEDYVDDLDGENKTIEVTPRKIQNLERVPIYKGLILKEFMTRHPWTPYIFEHNILESTQLSEIYEKGLFNLKKALQHVYAGMTFDKAKEYHQMSNVYHYFVKDVHDKDNKDMPYLDKIVDFLIYIDKVSTWEVGYRSPGFYFRSWFYKRHMSVFDKPAHFNLEWAKETQLGKLAGNVAQYANYLDRKVNCRWSESKLNDTNNKWTKEYASIIHKYDDRELVIPTLYKMVDEHTDLQLITTLSELSYEGFKQNHCVGGYEDTIECGECAVYRYKGFTIQLNYGFLRELRYAKSLRKNGLTINEFRGFSNIEPTWEIRKEVENIVVEFNKRLLSMPHETYIKACADIDEAYTKWNLKRNADMLEDERTGRRVNRRRGNVGGYDGEDVAVPDAGPRPMRWDDVRPPHPMDITEADLYDDELIEAPEERHDIMPLLNAIGDRHQLEHIGRIIEETRERIENPMIQNVALDTILDIVNRLAEAGAGEEEGAMLGQAIIRGETIDAEEFITTTLREEIQKEIRLEEEAAAGEEYTTRLTELVTDIRARVMEVADATDETLARGAEEVGEEYGYDTVSDEKYDSGSDYIDVRHSRDDVEIEAAVDYFIDLIGTVRKDLENSGVEMVIDEEQSGEHIKDIFALYISEYTDKDFTPEKFYEEHEDIIALAKEEMKTVDLTMISQSFQVLAQIQKDIDNPYYSVLEGLYLEHEKSSKP